MNIMFGKSEISCDAIAFDKDGVLIDSISFWWSLYESRSSLVLARQGQNILNDWTTAIGINIEERDINPCGVHASGSLQQEETVLALFITISQEISWNNAIKEARAILRDADINLSPETYTTPLPGIPEVIRRLHELGVPLAVVTQDQYRRVAETLKHLGLEGSIRVIITPSEVQHPKPAPDMLLLAAKYLGVHVSKLVMVGDSVADIEMASTAGAIPVYLSQDNVLPEIIKGKCKGIINFVSDIKIAL
jgi:phosphoglycolate phosphatase